MPADMIRQRKIRGKDYTGHEFKHGMIIDEESVGVWNMKCNHCGGIHLYKSREIEQQTHTKKCSKFKPHNWSGLERRDAIIRRQYGITQDDFNNLVESQDNLCGICGDELNKINIDHDHESGKVRGLLCTGCNTGLGHLGDNINGLEKALHYLKNTPYNEYTNAR
jgi:phage FluMu protein Com